MGTASYNDNIDEIAKILSEEMVRAINELKKESFMDKINNALKNIKKYKENM